MDSLTQIVLGAACGEAVAGKKLGNRALLWGAVGGTIPDLDVFAALFTDEITSTSFHRGFMHSFLFAVLAPWALAKLTTWFYSREIHRRPGYKISVMLLWLLFYLGAAAGINFIPVILGEGLNIYIFLPTLFLGVWFGWKLWKDYWKNPLAEVQAPYTVWVNLFFWSIFTHPILDCFTNWGTQIWQPFSDERVQWCTVSVVDPICTIPFGLALIVVSRFARTDRRRAWWNWGGFVWFLGYLLGYTLWHKHTVNQLFEAKLNAQNIAYQRYYTNPTIFNNIAWAGIAESDSAYYFGLYGFNDCKAEFGPLSAIPKNHHLLDPVSPDTRAGYFLRWFTEGYYNVIPYRGDTLQVNDLRFGLLGDTLRGKNYVFPFLVFKNEKGEWDIKQNNRNPESVKDSEASFGTLWKRITQGRCAPTPTPNNQ